MTGWSDCSYEAGPPCKKRKLKATTNMESLPDDIIFEILARVPAQDIYDSTRHVCRKWYEMTQTRDFVHSHLQRSTPGLLSVWQLTFITMQNDRIEISNLSYGFEDTILSSCNGLLLELQEDLEEPYITITNPVTKQHFALPPVVLALPPVVLALPPFVLALHPVLFTSNVMRHNRFAIAYAASSREYKVVHISDSYRDKYCGCTIMTVGVDTDWGRRVSTQHLSNTELLKESPLTTQGFVHWARNGCALKSNTQCVLTMNVESEIITQIPGPCLSLDVKALWYCYLPMGSYLSLLIACSKSSWEAWKMKPETGEWTKMTSIDVEPLFKHLSFGFKPLVGYWPNPVGWSNSREVLFFRVRLRITKASCYTTIPNTTFPIIIAYNIRTREIDSSYELDSREFVDHRSSLVWLD